METRSAHPAPVTRSPYVCLSAQCNFLSLINCQPHALAAISEGSVMRRAVDCVRLNIPPPVGLEERVMKYAGESLRSSEPHLQIDPSLLQPLFPSIKQQHGSRSAVPEDVTHFASPSTTSRLNEGMKRRRESSCSDRFTWGIQLAKESHIYDFGATDQTQPAAQESGSILCNREAECRNDKVTVKVDDAATAFCVSAQQIIRALFQSLLALQLPHQSQNAMFALVSYSNNAIPIASRTSSCPRLAMTVFPTCALESTPLDKQSSHSLSTYIIEPAFGIDGEFICSWHRTQMPPATVSHSDCQAGISVVCSRQPGASSGHGTRDGVKYGRMYTPSPCNVKTTGAHFVENILEHGVLGNMGDSFEAIVSALVLPRAFGSGQSRALNVSRGQPMSECLATDTPANTAATMERTKGDLQERCMSFLSYLSHHEWCLQVVHYVRHSITRRDNGTTCVCSILLHLEEANGKESETHDGTTRSHEGWSSTVLLSWNAAITPSLAHDSRHSGLPSHTMQQGASIASLLAADGRSPMQYICAVHIQALSAELSWNYTHGSETHNGTGSLIDLIHTVNSLT